MSGKCCLGPPLFGWLVDITLSYSLPLAIAATSQVLIMLIAHDNDDTFYEKGLQLKVGAQRTLRILVYYDFVVEMMI